MEFGLFNQQSMQGKAFSMTPLIP